MDKYRGGSKTMAATGPKKSLDTKNTDLNLSEDEKPTVHELKKLYLETIKLDVELQHQIYNLEKSYETKHGEIFNKRRKIIEEFKKKSTSGDVKSGDGDISQFWLRVLKASYTEFISKKDEQILAHLVDIRSQLFTEPTVKFTLTFYFEPNAYFTNRVLTKTYFLNCVPDVKDPLTYDGAEIYKCEGCTINWKPGHQPEKPTEKPHFQNVLSTYTTFFDFFSPPLLPEDSSDRSYGEAILQNDFELGFYLKERVIPKAVLFYTGEIADCQSSDESSDESEDENDDNDDEVDSESSGNGAQY